MCCFDGEEDGTQNHRVFSDDLFNCWPSHLFPITQREKQMSGTSAKESMRHRMRQACSHPFDVQIYMYIYIYIQRERERERDRYMYIYIYIYIYRDSCHSHSCLSVKPVPIFLRNTANPLTLSAGNSLFAADFKLLRVALESLEELGPNKHGDIKDLWLKSPFADVECLYDAGIFHGVFSTFHELSSELVTLCSASGGSNLVYILRFSEASFLILCRIPFV